MLFSEVRGEFEDLDRLQSTLESVGLSYILRNNQALDYFERPVGTFPLVVRKTYPLHADMFYVQEQNKLYCDQQDSMFIESLKLEQRYAEVGVCQLIKEMGLFVENIIPDVSPSKSDVVYQTFCEVPANIRVSKEGKITLTLFPNFPNIMPALKKLNEVELEIR